GKTRHPSGNGAEGVETRGYAVGETSRLETLNAHLGQTGISFPITIILPVHSTEGVGGIQNIRRAVESVAKNRESCDKTLKVLGVCTQEAYDDLWNTMAHILKDSFDVKVNDTGKTDYCSQVNFGVSCVDTDFFSILEADDMYTDNWFSMASRYYYSNEDVSVFLPINVCSDPDSKIWQYCNELVWAKAFSEKMGFLDKGALLTSSNFNLTGGIFNTKDFIAVGGLKTHMVVAFNYEFLLRVLTKDLKVYVVPKEGYVHVVGREGSISEHYTKTMDRKESEKWFKLAQSECVYTEDREVSVGKVDSEVLS
ncbi:MAG: hypothetical protein LUD72_13720, partial [Bacteroidales bacterium]|nr:hypothetical protein [Bacteroidales bacterium]